jgi:uncharacterized protein YkwD
MMSRTHQILLTILTAGFLAGCGQSSPSAPQVIASDTGPVVAASLSACPTAPLSRRFDQPIRRDAFDNQLFDAAILHFTNERRCANGLTALASDQGLRRAASIHSADMASRRFFSHTSPVPGRETLGKRLEESNVTVRGAAENIATRPRLQIDGGQPFFVKNSQRCEFTSQGSLIEPHSYKSLAKTFVTQWENSAGHRRNLLNPSYTRLGSGGSLQPNPKVCGDIVATQNFAS